MAWWQTACHVLKVGGAGKGALFPLLNAVCKNCVFSLLLWRFRERFFGASKLVGAVSAGPLAEPEGRAIFRDGGACRVHFLGMSFCAK